LRREVQCKDFRNHDGRDKQVVIAAGEGAKAALPPSITWFIKVNDLSRRKPNE